MTADNVQPTWITYATHDGVELQGDLYLAGAGPGPALVIVNGGGWAGACAPRSSIGGRIWRSAAMPSSPSATGSPSRAEDLPEVVHDVRRRAIHARQGRGLRLDPRPIALWGIPPAPISPRWSRSPASPFRRRLSAGPACRTRTKVKVLIGTYGIYDLLAQWRRYQIQPGDNLEEFLGASPRRTAALFRRLADQLRHRRQQQDRRAPDLRGTEDDVVDRTAHPDAEFLLALKQADFNVRPCVVHGAPHYWLSDPIDEPGSHSGFLGAAALTLSGRETLSALPYFFSNSSVPSLRINGWMVCGDLGQKPRQHDFEPHMVVEHLDGAARRLRQRGDAELQAVVDPGLFLERKELAKFFLGAAHARFQAAEPLRPCRGGAGW